MKETRIAIAVLAAMLAAGGRATAGAQERPRDAAAPVTYEGVPYVTGGIGRDERERLLAVSRDYNLKLVFAVKQSTAFLSDVHVVVQDEGGKTVLDATSSGPWFFARLPAGKYKVLATTTGGATQEQSAQVPATGQAEAHFYWQTG
jgi:hypothetical protein